MYRSASPILDPCFVDVDECFASKRMPANYCVRLQDEEMARTPVTARALVVVGDEDGSLAVG